MKFDPNKHHRRSIRLKGFDYAQSGGYFITIVTYHRDLLFGEVVNKEMRLNEFGKIADECWRAIPEHFPNVELGAFVIMPKHVHGIVVINNDGRGTIYRAPTQEQFQKPVKGSIPTIIRTFKSAVTRLIGREHNATGIWQKNYYEHIIRNHEDWDRIHQYIKSNPSMWAEDEENPLKM
ncbi:MAG: transposase [Anaerolineales bacterium]|nr:transposase [Anaerolineales bacterium]